MVCSLRILGPPRTCASASHLSQSSSQVGVPAPPPREDGFFLSSDARITFLPSSVGVTVTRCPLCTCFPGLCLLGDLYVKYRMSL